MNLSLRKQLFKQYFRKNFYQTGSLTRISVTPLRGGYIALPAVNKDHLINTLIDR